jgi:nucleoside 2-deoxyribosyltransferase
MNCFVIMPFSGDFDDVYSSIKLGVEGALSTSGGRCFRLDESRPAGRITERLLGELQSAAFCVADLTGNKANVMWEVGYAMALAKP